MSLEQVRGDKKLGLRKGYALRLCIRLCGPLIHAIPSVDTKASARPPWTTDTSGSVISRLTACWWQVQSLRALFCFDCLIFAYTYALNVAVCLDARACSGSCSVRSYSCLLLVCVPLVLLLLPVPLHGRMNESVCICVGEACSELLETKQTNVDPAFSILERGYVRFTCG